jgi:alkylhydroperoxidase family enzyme
MARIDPVEPQTATAEQQAALHWIEVQRYGTATNMKRTLARSPVALRALLQWYPLRQEVAAFLGDRGVSLFCHAVSSGTACLLCTTYFRRELIDSGEDPAALVIAEPLSSVVEFGAALATDPNAISDALWARLAAVYDEAQLVTLTTFGTLMIATNLFNNALHVELDPSLLAYRAPEARHG